MVIASAGHTASHSLQAMQRSSPLGYRRSACRPRNRGDCGVFSSGNCTVILRANRWRPVSIMPRRSSIRSRLPKKFVIRFMARSMEEIPIRCLHHAADHDDPDKGNGNEYLPAQPHDLVVAVARKGGAEP